jgi:UDP-glucuronate 4-epimerase
MGHYLVTGTAGFIGARTAGMLLAEGHSVMGVDNLNNAYDVRMKEYRLRQLLVQPGFVFHKIDISDRQAVQSLSVQRGIDGVINLAARAGVRQSVEDPWAFMQTNVTGTLNLLELSRRNDIPKFILASTSSVYGANAPIPTPETADSDHPMQPYAASKKGAEALCHSYHSIYGLDVTVVRYFTVYGPAGRPDMSMFRMVRWIREGEKVQMYGDGRQSRGFTFVDDIARGTIAALKPLKFEVVNLGGHEVLSMNALAKMLGRLTGREAEVEYLPRNLADMMTSQADVTKAKKLLGWQPEVSLEEGVRRTVEWYQAERAWVKDIALQ